MDESTGAFEMNVKPLNATASTGWLPSASIFEAAKQYGRNFEVNLKNAMEIDFCFENPMLLPQALPCKDSFSEIGLFPSYTWTYVRKNFLQGMKSNIKSK